MLNNLSGHRKNAVVGLKSTENNRKQKKKESVPNDDSMLQPITKVNSKLDKEMQEWEVDSTHSAG
jgi:hypothetical protein